jgi:hypothetical protein
MKSAIPAVIESLKEELKRGIDWQVKDAAMKEIQTYVVDWVKENIIPAIGDELLGMKGELIEAGKQTAGVISDSLAEAVRNSIHEKLEHSWDRKKIFAALLGD